jgi:hypothetical protein
MLLVDPLKRITIPEVSNMLYLHVMIGMYHGMPHDLQLSHSCSLLLLLLPLLLLAPPASQQSQQQLLS